jgi:hypothetical protein
MNISEEELTARSKLVAIHRPFVGVYVIRDDSSPTGDLQAHSHQPDAGKEFAERGPQIAYPK